jgi:hypothetical protein
VQRNGIGSGEENGGSTGAPDGASGIGTIRGSEAEADRERERGGETHEGFHLATPN